MIDPHPQVTVDEQLLPQQRHQIGKRPAEGGLQLQVLDQQYGDQRRPDLRLQGVGGSPDEGLHPQIELFFKALKQNLRVKTFIGTSANALKTQVWAALIAILLIKYLQLKATFGWSLSNLVALLRQQLFVYRDLWVWIDHPFQAPELPAALPEQLAMVWQ